MVVHFFVSLIFIRLFSGLGISNCLTSDTLSDTVSDTLCFVLQNLVFSRVLFKVRQENEAVSALICSDTVSDTVSDTLCVALIFSPYNIAFDCPFLCFIKITFVCLADWGSASDTLSDTLSDTISFSPSNIAFGCPFLSLIKITFVCLADWGSASDTLSDALIFSPLNIALVVHFFVSLRSRSFVERIEDQQVSY